MKDLRDTREATVQGDLFSPDATGGGAETLVCEGAGYGKTVWYDFQPDAFGTTEIQVAGYDAVVAVYEFDRRGSRITRPVACSNDPGVAEDMFVQVEPGHAYTIQVGGVDAGAGPAGGDLQLTFQFFADTDRDGLFDPLDKCPTRKGVKAAAGCPPKLSSSPKLRAAPAPGGVRVQDLSVTATRGASVEVVCRRGCKLRQARKARRVAFSALRGRFLPAGAVLEIRVTKRDSIGVYHRYDIVSGNFRRTDRCLPPGSKRPRRKC